MTTASSSQTPHIANVLVVDDHPASLELMGEILRDVAKKPFLVSSGQEALEVIERHSIAVALLDLNMPGMDGFEVARRIRASDAGRDTAIIFVTGTTDVMEATARAYALGAVDFMSKPLDPNVVRAKVAVFLDLHRKTAEVKRQADLLTRAEMLRHDRELAHERELRQAQKLEAVAILAAGVAHHFNNILQIIMGHVETLMDVGKLDDAGIKSLEVMQRTGERGAALVQRLLVFSRRDSPKVMVANLDNAVAEAVALIRPALPKTIEARVDIGPGAHKVLADARELELMIVNLALNSRDAMPNGGTLTIRTASGEEELEGAVVPTCHLYITDTGNGMSDEVKTHLFEPFFTTKGPARGTGLGLATVHAIVKRGGGHIRVDSEVGKGSTIEVIFPQASAASRSSRLTGALLETPRGKSETVLVVEDEEDLRELVVQQLMVAGYKVLEARNGETALKIGRDLGTPIDLLLCDAVIPAPAGPAVVEELSRLRPTMRSILMTAYDDEALEREVGKDRSDVGLRKPFRMPELLKLVRDTLDDEARATENLAPKRSGA